MNRFESLEAFTAVVERGSFSAAARTLGLTPSAISKQISHLEERLGARLFNRTTRRMHLTEAGQAFFDRAHVALEVLEEAEGAVSTLSDSPSGHLRITMPVGFGLIHVTPLLSDFLTQHPKISLDIDTSNQFIDIVEQGIDVAIRVGSLPDSTLRARRLRSFRWIVCASPDYLAQHGTPREPGDLADHACLTITHITRAWPFTGADGDFSVRVSGPLSSVSAEVLHAMAVGGMGVARMSSYMIADELRSGALVPLLTEYAWREETNVYAVYPETRHLSPKVRAFIDYLVTHLRQPEDWEVAGAPRPMV